MDLKRSLVLLCGYLILVTGRGEDCKYDSDCAAAEYCLEKNHLCAPCENCTTSHKREEKNQCAKSSKECGNCIPGYYEDDDDIRIGEQRPEHCRKEITTTKRTTEMYEKINPTTIMKESQSTIVPEDMRTTGNNTILITGIIIGIIALAAIGIIIFILIKQKRIPGIVKRFVRRNQTDSEVAESERLTTSPDIQANDTNTNRLTYTISDTNPRKTENVNQTSRPFNPTYDEIPMPAQAQNIVNDDEAQPDQHIVNIPDNSIPDEDGEVLGPISLAPSNLAQPTRSCSPTPPLNESKNSENDNQSEGINIINNNYLQSRNYVTIINNISYQPNTNEASGNNRSEFSSSASLPNSQISTETLLMIQDNINNNIIS